MTYLILGATSDVAIEFAKQCPKGSMVYLCARKSERLEPVLKHLKITSDITCELIEFDLINDKDYSAILSKSKVCEVVLVAWGILESAKTDSAQNVLEVLDANFRNQVPIIEAIALEFEKRGSGVIAGMTSVAGLRGRASNYMYGSAKAGMIAYLSGIRNRLTPSGAHVMTVIPGFMRTKMTANLNLPAPLTASPDRAAKLIHRAIVKRKNVVYVTGIWWILMTIIRNIPEFIFKKLKL
jgi:decaprenylphospho-beta-D-erythro-pentofuranosid-2-ulose 2-reductase